MEELTHLKQDPGVTPCHVHWMVGQGTRWQPSLPAAGGGHQLQGEMMTGWLIGYQGNQQRDRPLTTPLISVMGSSDLKLEQSLTGAWGKCVGRSVMCIGRA